jgi:hypothetical protein
MKKLALAAVLTLLSAASMAALVTSGNEVVKNTYGETWETPTSK